MKDVTRTTRWTPKAAAATTANADRSRFAWAAELGGASCELTGGVSCELFGGCQPSPSSAMPAGRLLRSNVSRPTGPRSTMLRSALPRRRGTALILVVAVLGILFVAGAALLNQVTFSTSTLQAAREARQTEAAIDAIEDMALGWLANGFIGPDGLALNPESRLVAHKAGQPTMPCDGADDCVLTLPTYSEVPGIHPIDFNEPVNEDVTGFSADLRYKLFSNPVFAVNNKPGVDPKYANNPDVRGAAVDVAFPLVKTWNADASSDNSYDYLRDADGDGIVDSFQFPLPNGVLPAEIHREWADRLRDPNYNQFDPDRDPDQLWVSLKVVPHGSMLDLNSAADTMVNYFFTLNPSSGDWTGNTFSPQTNEWYLRHRGLMLPRTLPRTTLLEDYGNFLIPPHESPKGGGTPAMTLLANPGMREWWGYDFAIDANNASSEWTRMVLDPNSPDYDFVHNVTTINHDDQLMRPIRDPATGVDIIDLMRSTDGVGAWASGSTYALDNYPQKLDLNTMQPDPRLGRLKVSFSELTDMLTGVGLKNLSQFPAARERIVGTIQQTFLLMLSNHRDFNRNNTPDEAIDDYQRAVVAAMLTANLIDFADNDDSGVTGDLNGESIGVDVVGIDGQPVVPPLTVFGFERQPFITEVHAQATPAPPPAMVLDELQSSFAIELYNPYSTVIHLDEYHLKDVGGSTPLDYLAGTAVRLDEDLMSLSTRTIQPGGFYVIYAGTFAAPAGIAAGSDSEQSGNAWSLDENSVIQLTRTVNTPGGPIEIVVDEFNVNVDIAAVSTTATPAPINAAGAAAVSWERDNSEWIPGESRWRFVVPRVGETLNGTPAHTLGDLNTFMDPTIYSVHVDVANLVNFEDAYPTTGSMLLIPRTAHVYDPDPAGTLTSPFNRVNVTMNVLPSNIQTEFDRIDNGRIPVFDLAVNNAVTPPTPSIPAHRDASNHIGGGLVEGIEALPWGQLLFDYFTGLPLESCDPADVTCGLNKKWPKVDQEGLRVQGRININAASALVLSTAPTLRLGKFPMGFRGDISDALYGNRFGNANQEGQLGLNAAKAIVWYREAMDTGAFQSTWDFEAARDPYSTSAVTSPTPYVPRQGYGFLTVGELLNVISSNPGSGQADSYGLDAGTVERSQISANNQQSVYDRAVGRMVALGDWFTTRSHVFTVYGVVRGQFNDDPNPVELEKSLRATDQRAIRFQSTVDRLPMFFGRMKPERIGARVVGGYADVRAE